MKWVLALGLCVAIAGCATSETPALLASADDICKSRGAHPGTQQYVQCRNRLEAQAEADSARAQAQARADMARAQAQAQADAARAHAQAQAQAQADMARAQCIGAHPTNPGGCF